MATSTDNVKQLLEICDDSQVQEELDVLQAIFIDEIQEERDEKITLKPSAKILPFPGDLQQWQKKGESALKKKSKTLRAFHEDVDWAMMCKHEDTPLVPKNSEDTSHTPLVTKNNGDTPHTPLVTKNSEDTSHTPLVTKNNEDTSLVAKTNEDTPHTPLITKNSEDTSHTPLVTKNNEDTSLVTKTNEDTSLVTKNNEDTPLVITNNEDTSLVTKNSEGTPHTPLVTKNNEDTSLVTKNNEDTPLVITNKLSKYLITEIGSLDLTNWDYSNVKKTAVLTLARLTLYNRRRCHEVQALRVDVYNRRKAGVDEVALEMLRELTPFENELLKRQEMVEIRGKTGRGVPVILPADTLKPLQFLANPDVRATAGIQVTNPYLFANSLAGVFRAYDAIRNVSIQAGLVMPQLVRTSNMRKYMATMLQSLDTNDSERQWVVDHLGHTMNIHMTSYRQTSDILERVDVSKLLLIQDFGLVHSYVGKKLKDIQLDDIISEIGVKHDITCNTVPTSADEPSFENNENCIPDLVDAYDSDEHGDVPSSCTRKKPKNPGTSSGRPVSISIQLHPATAQDLQKQFVCVLLEMTLPPEYPDEPPEIVMKNPRGLGDEELLGLQAAMHDLARERRGGPMLYELIELAKESLTEGNIPRCPCVICLEHFNDGDLFTRTPCYHYYHNYCLGKYIQHRITVHEADAHPTGQGEFQIYCPVCREPLTYDLDALKASPPPIGDDILFEITPDIIRQQCEMELMLRNQKAKGGIIDVEAEKNKLFIPSTPFLVPFTTEEPVPNLDSDGGKKKPKVDVVESHDRKGKPSRRQGYGRTTDKPARGPAGSNQSSNYSKGDRSQYHSQRKPNREEKYDAYYKHRRRNENRSTNGSNLNDQRDRLPDEHVRYDDGDLEVDGISEESGKEETDRSRNKGTYSRSQKHNLGPDRRKIVLKQNQEYSNDSDECTDSSRQLSVQNENERTQFEISNKIDKKGDYYERRPARQICNNKTSSHRKDYGRYKNDAYENYDNTDKENPRGSRRRDDDNESTGAYKHKERYSKVKRSDMSSPNGVRNPGDGDRTSKNCAISNKRNSDWKPRDTRREGMSDNDQCQSAAIKESRSNNRQQLSLAKNEQIGTVDNKYHAKVLGSDGQRTNEMAALDGDGQRTNEMAALDRDGQRTNEMAALDSAEELTNEMAACAREINEALDSSSFCPSSMQHQSVDTRDVFQNGVKPEGRVSIRGHGFSKNKKELEDSKSLSDISQILMNPDSDKSGSVHSSEWVPKGTSQIKSASSATKSSMLTEDVKPSFKSKEWIPNDLPKQNHDVGNKNTVKSKTTSTGPPGFKVTRPPPGFQQNANDYRTPPGFGRVS